MVNWDKSGILFLIGVTLYLGWIKEINYGILAVTAASLPHAAYSLFNCLYLILALRFESTIFGLIKLNQEPLQNGCLEFEVTFNPSRTKKYTLREINNGQFVFRVWLVKSEARCRIRTLVEGTTQYLSEDISVKKVEHVNYQPLTLYLCLCNNLIE
ncbi:MAG: hypothetical protein AB9891_04530 [Anaerolineaceae bacterium]